ncbi:MAG: hypothetical protein A3F11_05305 [Gammaproteobacteria bacterium RIFCSPHIGHO2_12_FULL_37_14]|nr:MAG: hypothetical protein A3F11_05305 [Gammaproteobacteria bacterium RIFCSPHIGHO2_12_FULL_37_14]
MLHELYIAVTDKENGYLKVKQLIEEKKVSVNALEHPYTITVVAKAAQFGSLATLKYLIENAQADLDASKSNENLLFWALKNSDKNIIPYLVNPENQIINRLNDGTTDLHAAAASGQYDVVENILRVEPHRIFEENNRNETVLFWAARAKQKTIIDFIMHFPTFTSREFPQKWDPLHRYFGDKNYRRGEKYQIAKKYNQALATYQAAIIYYKKIIKLTDYDYEMLANCHRKRSSIYLFDKEIDDPAILNAQESIKYCKLIKNESHLRHHLAEAHFNLGNIYEYQSKTEEAIDAFECAIVSQGKDKMNPSIYLNSLINCYLEQKKYTKAIDTLIIEIDCLKRLNPQSIEESNHLNRSLAWVYTTLARLYCQSSNKTANIEEKQREGIHFLESITVKTEDDICDIAKHYKRLGLYCIRQHHHEEAVIALQDSITYCHKIKSVFKKTFLLDKHQSLFNIYAHAHAHAHAHEYPRVIALGKALRDEAKTWGYEVLDTESDGDCFFHAAADQMIKHLPSSSDPIHPTVLRTQTADHIEQHLKEYGGFMDQETPEKYLDELRKSGTWADHLTILAFSREFNLSLVILQSDGRTPIIFKRLNPNAILYLGYEIDWHYQSLLFHPDWQTTKSIQPMIDNAPVDNFISSKKRKCEEDNNPISSKKQKREKDNDLLPLKIYPSSQTLFEKNLPLQKNSTTNPKSEIVRYDFSYH